MASADFPAKAGISRNKRTCFRCTHAGSTQSRSERERDFSVIGRLIFRNVPSIQFLFVMSHL